MQINSPIQFNIIILLFCRCSCQRTSCFFQNGKTQSILCICAHHTIKNSITFDWCAGFWGPLNSFERVTTCRIWDNKQPLLSACSCKNTLEHGFIHSTVYILGFFPACRANFEDKSRITRGP